MIELYESWGMNTAYFVEHYYHPKFSQVLFRWVGGQVQSTTLNGHDITSSQIYCYSY